MRINWSFGKFVNMLRSKFEFLTNLKTKFLTFLDKFLTIFKQISNNFFKTFSRQDRVNIIPTTRTSTGKLPLPRQLDLPDSSSTRVFSPKITSGDVKEKMEQQLRAQREANNKKRAEEMKQGKKMKNCV